MEARAKGRARLTLCVAILLGTLTSTAAAQLTITPVTVGDFGTTTLNGSARTLTASIDNFTVTDSRLIPTGWNVTVSATQFAEYDTVIGYVPGGRTIPTGSLRMEAPTVAPVGPIVTPGPYLIDGATVKIASALPATLPGSYVFTQGGPLTLTVGAGTFATTYRSSVSVTVAAGP